MTELSILPLRSSSKGNATLVYNDTAKILVDCGVSGKILEGCLAERDIDPTEINAIAVTHEHTDHIKGVGVFSRKYDIPIYASAKTWSAMHKVIGKIDENNIRSFEVGRAFEIRDIKVTSFQISHDAAEPVGYVFETEKCKAAVATDMGVADDAVISALSGSSVALIESNYDLHMLEIGRYPYELKQRIKSRTGHLCNDDAAELARTLIGAGAEKIILGHLSEENNFSYLAYQTVKNYLEGAGIAVGKDAELYVVERGRTGEICPV